MEFDPDADDGLGKFEFGPEGGLGNLSLQDDAFMDTEDPNGFGDPLAGVGGRFGYNGAGEFSSSNFKSAVRNLSCVVFCCREVVNEWWMLQAGSQSMSDFRSIGAPREYVKDASVGGKRTAQGMARIKKFEMEDKSVLSCPDLANLEGGNGKMEDTEDKKQKRLARNRAAARMRRQRRKTIVDTLERELVDLERSISVLKDVNAYLDKNGGFNTPDHSVPVPVMKRAIETAPSVDNSSLETPNLDFDDDEGKGADHNVETPAQAKMEMLRFLIGDSKDKYSISQTRRRAAIQYFIDNQISACRKLSLLGARSSAVSIIAANTGKKRQYEAGMEAPVEMLRKARNQALCHHLPGSPGGPPVRMNNPSSNANDSLQDPSASNGTNTARRGVLIDTKTTMDGKTVVSTDNLKEVEALRADLMNVLELKPAQMKQLKKLSQGLEIEQVRLHALERASLALACHDWLEFPFLEQAQTQFRGLLSNKQLSLFHYFIKKNERQIKLLNLEAKMR